MSRQPPLAAGPGADREPARPVAVLHTPGPCRRSTQVERTCPRPMTPASGVNEPAPVALLRPAPGSGPRSRRASPTSPRRGCAGRAATPVRNRPAGVAAPTPQRRGDPVTLTRPGGSGCRRGTALTLRALLRRRTPRAVPVPHRRRTAPRPPGPRSRWRSTTTPASPHASALTSRKATTDGTHDDRPLPRRARRTRRHDLRCRGQRRVTSTTRR